MSPRTSDVLLSTGVVVGLAVVVSSEHGEHAPVPPAAYLWTVGLGLLLLLRRQRPVLVLVLTTVVFFSYYVMQFPAIGVAVPIAAALFSAAEMGHVRAALVTAMVVMGLSTAYRLIAGQDAAYVVGYELIGHVALAAAAIALGHSLRVGRQLRRRTEQVTGLLARQGELDTDARAREERLRLARELHDSIGHSLSVATLYTDVARERAHDPAAQREALDLVRGAVSDALSQLRRTVTVLRRRGSLVGADPGLLDLSALTAAPAAAGYDVDLFVQEVEVAPEVGAAAYRLVQEAITNTLRHSNGTRIGVRLEQPTPGLLELLVSDNGDVAVSDRGTGAGHGAQGVPGHGLSGMRERVSDLGGTLDVRTGPNGWSVRATIPTGGAP